MICVSIARGRHKQMAAEHCHLVDQGAQLVELRLDYLRRDVDLGRLLTDRPCPVIATCRRESDSGRWTGSEEARLTLLRAAIVAGVDYVDLEEDIAGSIPRYGQTKRIVSYHNFQETPENLEEIRANLAELDADIVKLATMANSMQDNLRMLRLVRDSDIPTAGMCMGDIGTPSRLLAGKFGAPFTYATFHHERTLAPGQLTYRQMTEIYDYDHIGPDTEIYGVIADPVGDAPHPVVHNAAFRRLDLDKAYLPFRVPPEDLDQFFDDCGELDIKGLSVAIPHKEAAIHCLHRFDEASESISVVNTVIFEDEDRVGYNTEERAATESLSSAFGEEPDREPLRGKSVLILGAGTLAKAIGLGMKRSGAHVTVAARDTRRAEALAERLDCRIIDWASRHAMTPNVLINATPVGAHPDVNETPYDRHHLRRSMIVFDTVHYPEQTLLIKEARKQN